ncbi:MAG: Serine/threonine-protein kinase tel1 [Piccolia ochrophora]|nr:MAG: Serine/threonine-protein kinase tel1 [Piccolia ochrophora]
MAETTTLKDALDRVSSKSIKERVEGLEDLKRILQDESSAAYNAIFEALHRAVAEEMRHTRPSATRLSDTARTLRIAVEAGVPKLKQRTVESLISHITQTLNRADQRTTLEPLGLDYIKCLHTILRYQPHVEHFTKDQWVETVDFCCEWVHRQGHHHQQASSSTASTRLSHGQSRILADELVLCVEQLCATPNAPIDLRADHIQLTLVDVLGDTSKIGRSHQGALSAINAVFTRTHCDDLDLARGVLRRLLPIIKVLWYSKVASLKEEILVTLIITQTHVEAMMRGEERDELQLHLSNLLEVMQSEYIKRLDREQLQLDDIIFSSGTHFGCRGSPLRFQTMSLRGNVVRAEQSWAVLQMMSMLVHVLDSTTPMDGINVAGEDVASSRKRRKVVNYMEEAMNQAKPSNTNHSARLCAIQTIVFALGQRLMPPASIELIVDRFTSYMSSDDHVVVAWTMVALAICALQKPSTPRPSESTWIQTWLLASRAATSSSTCRVACHLMEVILVSKLVSYRGIANAVEGMMTFVDANGPATATDTALSFWSILLPLRNDANPSARKENSEKVLHWLFSKWIPRRLTARSAGTQYALQHHPEAIVLLLLKCVGQTGSIYDECPDRCLPYGRIGQAWCHHDQHDKLLRYLLLLDASEDLVSLDVNRERKHHEMSSLSPQIYLPIRSTILDFCITEFDCAADVWNAHSAERAEHIPPDMLRGLSSLCIIGTALTSQFKAQDLHRSMELSKRCHLLLNSLSSYISRSECTLSLVDSVLESVYPFLLSTTLGEGQVSKALDRESENLFRNVLQALDNRRERAEDPFDGRSAADSMDIDLGFKLRHKQVEKVQRKPVLPRHDGAATADLELFRHNIQCRIQLLCCTLGESAVASSSRISRWTDHLTSLSAYDFLACHGILQEVVSRGTRIERDDGRKLLLFIAKNILPCYDYERCEFSLGVCVNVMTVLANLMSSHISDSFIQASADIYKWLVSVALQKGIMSPKVQVHTAALLFRLLEAQPGYAGRRGLMAERKGLLQILERGNNPVKYYVTGLIPKMFEFLTISRHEALFGDVLMYLPSEGDWAPSMALRLLVLTDIASRWTRLLRPSLYQIFETSGRVPLALGHAVRCFRRLSHGLHLSGPIEISSLFLPQILYSWLETETVQSIPYTIFGYESLRALLNSAQDETMGQLMMRGSDDQLRTVANLMNKPLKALVAESFERIVAYSIARDISFPLPDDADKKTGSEYRVRKIVGNDQFVHQVNAKFAQILSVLFLSLEGEEHVYKAFAREESYGYASKILEEIKGHSRVAAGLPANQQPSFKAKFLVNEIEHLCYRTGRRSSDLWSSPMVTFILRRLLESSHPAQGSSNTCSVIRKIRILISIAGKTAIEGYPLEKLLHSLRPYLTDLQCAEDTIGLFRYLLRAGRPYLELNPSVVAGTALSVLASIEVILNWSPERTTAYDHFQAIQQAAREFRGWLGPYLKSYTSPLLSGSFHDAFQDIVHSAMYVRDHGSATVGTKEGRMLLDLLEDQRSGRNLLSRPSQALALSMLCSDFEKPNSFREDILGDNDSSIAYAATVWSSCHRPGHSEGYLQWVGRVLGRAYVSTGNVPKDLLPESILKRLKDRSFGTAETTTGPKPAILRTLQDLLLEDPPTQVGLVEGTLQLIGCRLSRPEDIAEFEQSLQGQLLSAITWTDIPVPDEKFILPTFRSVGEVTKSEMSDSVDTWIKDLCIALAFKASSDPVVGSLLAVLNAIPSLAEQIFPFVLHVVLLRELDTDQTTRAEVSKAMQVMLKICDEFNLKAVRTLLTAVLYLRNQPLPCESTIADRESWLDVDHWQAAEAAAKCGMFKTSLLFAEIQNSQETRLSSSPKAWEPTELLLTIYKNVDEPDSFYGVQRSAGFTSIIDRLDFEKDGPKGLAFANAAFENHLRQGDRTVTTGSTSVVRALDNMGLNYLTHSLLRESPMIYPEEDNAGTMYKSAQRLEKWDLPNFTLPHSENGTIYRALQCINNVSEPQQMFRNLDLEFTRIMSAVVENKLSGTSLRPLLRVLAVLTEVDEVLTSSDGSQIQEVWSRLLSRNSWMQVGRFEDVEQILFARKNVLTSLSRRSHLRDLVKAHPAEIRKVEVGSMLVLSQISRTHHSLQTSLSTATGLGALVSPCEEVGVHISAAVQRETSKVLWDQGEMTAAIRVLQDLLGGTNLEMESIKVGRAELLADLGHMISEARLEKPEEIISNYLLKAIEELKDASSGDEAGHVYHEFASFCDRQLQDSENLEEFTRVQELRQQKETDVRDLEVMLQSAGSQAKANLQAHQSRAQKWLELDNREFQRLRDSRETFLRQSLENYLLCLKSCETFNNDVLRFCALWLEQSTNGIANRAVSDHIKKVPSRKFAALMNQLSSRLLDPANDFQLTLSNLVLRLCIDHPYHGMYQIFSTSKGRGTDEQTVSRVAAAVKVIDKLKKHSSASRTWYAVSRSNECYIKLATEKLMETQKARTRAVLRRTPAGLLIERDVPKLITPPLTMSIEIQADCDYRKVPVVTSFDPELSIAVGVSAPKIISVIASDGVRYKQLVKGGNDDLRQDAIMEQVFHQVSQVFKKDRATRQRELGIRTYKVLPLTTNTGVIEFVPNTIPLAEYLVPAHDRYFPRDWKALSCRKAISDVQSETIQTRLRAYRIASDHFHPVMRYFFMERFDNPDDWFDKRLAYCRSTATISILGHVLGLGDRHGHNILLDERTGEVVHIDFGVAFDQGRVLPLPEVVPFRLTRDIVDGMGITKTEGVFRRCCEFTLEALRKESYSIVTILDVLRYDPLYSWTISPLRIKRMQEEQDRVHDDFPEHANAPNNAKKGANNEPGEADRALSVVTKKLSKTLSVTATVNELIQQASDERNLAVLFCGWAAYA